ncbi:competence protein ComER [Kroppenstedtia sanguinis]|uniref:Pyrroline-5-carboxylate reductase n=1 Tax=Kroppenstedtia sanguinis TaxID=1380684 RepID=A0ABW4C7V7_9BACL
MTHGVIGTGSMGRILVEAWIRSGKLQPSELLVSNRTRAKAEGLADEFPGLRVAADNRQVAQESDCFFLCVKPGEFRRVLEEIQDVVQAEQIVVSITSPVMVRDLEQWLPAKVAKVIPSITHAVYSGNSLFIPGSRLHREDREKLWDLFSSISRPLHVDEAHTRIASDLACCAPAFLANLMEQMAEAAVKETGLPRETAISLVTQMAQGLGHLLAEGNFTLQSLQERVAVPGGITREGLHLLERDLGTLFHDLFRLTHDKYEEDIHKVQQSLFPEVEKKV